MITIQCPHCQTQYDLEEKTLGDHPSLRLRCTKCQNTFPIQVSAGTAPMPGRPVPVQHHDEFNKRLRTAPPPCSLDATTVMGGGRPWIDRGKVVSLLVIDGPLKGKVFPVIKPRVLLGRGETDIVLEDSEISRKHCAVEVRGASALLVDLDSTNGTFVDDQRIETHQLEHMSEFRIGSTVMMFSARAKE